MASDYEKSVEILPSAQEVVEFYGGEVWDGEEADSIEEFRMSEVDLEKWQKQKKGLNGITGRSRAMR